MNATHATAAGAWADWWGLWWPERIGAVVFVALAAWCVLWPLARWAFRDRRRS